MKSSLGGSSKRLAMVLVCGSLLSLGACQSRAPMVESSVGEEVLARQQDAGAGQLLDFFDRLNERARVCQDDVLTGVLLVKKGVAPAGEQGYARRVEMGKELGILNADFNKPALQAATTGEVATMVVSAAAKSGGPVTEADAIRVLTAGAWMPAGLSGTELASGTQAFNALGGLSDLLAAGGVDLPPDSTTTTTTTSTTTTTTTTSTSTTTADKPAPAAAMNEGNAPASVRTENPAPSGKRTAEKTPASLSGLTADNAATGMPEAKAEPVRVAPAAPAAATAPAKPVAPVAPAAPVAPVAAATATSTPPAAPAPAPVAAAPTAPRGPATG
ncbi:MAG: hypothetical protein K2X32_05985, partial [Phycisphaerales bacterium]|nr:hypothetical protein [Phycisphaerales bacterium]